MYCIYLYISICIVYTCFAGCGSRPNRHHHRQGAGAARQGPGPPAAGPGPPAEGPVAARTVRAAAAAVGPGGGRAPWG